jgi:uncharacterized protein YjbI with pentapeptide repeats
MRKDTMGEIRNIRGEVIFTYSDMLKDTNLAGANLRGAVLVSTDLRDADLVGADLRGAKLRSANFRDAVLRGAELGNADLRGANLAGADLRNADLVGADLVGANLRGADPWRANLRDIKTSGYSDELAAYILFNAAGDDVQKRSIAGLILISKDWSWKKLLTVEYPCRAWAIQVLSRVDGYDRKLKECGVVA